MLLFWCNHMARVLLWCNSINTWLIKRSQWVCPLVFHHFFFILFLIFNMVSERMARSPFVLGKPFHSGHHTHMEVVIEVGTHQGIRCIFLYLGPSTHLSLWGTMTPFPQCTLFSTKVGFQHAFYSEKVWYQHTIHLSKVQQHRVHFSKWLTQRCIEESIFP